jgi:hypothetical protein
MSVCVHRGNLKRGHPGQSQKKMSSRPFLQHILRSVIAGWPPPPPLLQLLMHAAASATDYWPFLPLPLKQATCLSHVCCLCVRSRQERQSEIAKLSLG